MQFATTRRGPFVVVCLEGELDIHGYQAVAADLHRLVAERPTGLIVDLSRLRYVASIGISLFIQLAQEMRTVAGHELRLAGPQPRIQILLDHVHLSNLIPIDPTVDAAVAQMEHRRVAALVA